MPQTGTTSEPKGTLYKLNQTDPHTNVTIVIKWVT